MQAPNGYGRGTGRIGSALALLDGILRITGVISVASLSQEFVVWSNWIALAISWYKAVMYPAITALFSSLNLFDPSHKSEKVEPSAEIPPQEDGVAESRDYPMNAEESEPLLQVSTTLKDAEALLSPAFDLITLLLILLLLTAVIMIQSEFGLRQVRYLGLSIIKSKVIDAVSWIVIGFTVLLVVNLAFG